MKHCKECGIDIKTKRKTCPLCFSLLEDKEVKGETSLQKYPKKNIKKKLSTPMKIVIFLSLLAMLVCMAINIVTYPTSKTYWSILVAVTIIYLWILIMYVIKGRGLLTVRIMSAGLTTAILVILVELTVCFVNKVNDRTMYWSINYVLPSMMILTMLALVIICLIRKDLYSDTIIMMFTMAILSSILFIVDVCSSLIIISWPTLACFLSGLALILGMFVFTFKETIEELKKRFHI